MKKRRYVTRWLLAYEMTNERGEWIPRLNTLTTRQLARRQVTAYRHLPYVRNIAPPQAVKVRVS